jgi:TetR/AcrR family transcriptional regulator
VASERTRRAPAPGERQRDAERTKERILDAARAEFGAKGFAGARVSAIAERAGVNKQLISYYFGGKQGLYDVLTAQFHETGRQLAAPELPVDQVVASFVLSSWDNRDWSRLLAWEGLADNRQRAEQPQQREFMRNQVNDVAARQAHGELPADLDPAYLLLALISAASAGVVLPNLVRSITGDDPESPEFHHRYAEQLARLVSHLRRPQH